MTLGVALARFLPDGWGAGPWNRHPPSTPRRDRGIRATGPQAAVVVPAQRSVDLDDGYVDSARVVARDVPKPRCILVVERGRSADPLRRSQRRVRWRRLLPGDSESGSVCEDGH